MTTQTARIAIVGAGLSGLYAALLLQQRGITDYVVLEARDAPGGRIVSTAAAPPQLPGSAEASATPGRFDLGPSWFWPDFQPQLGQLTQALGLSHFKQFDTGDMLVERSSNEAPTSMRGFDNVPPSMRLQGGMYALIDALSLRVNAAQIHTQQVVRHVRRTSTHVELDSVDRQGQTTTWAVEHVLLAMPPRLAADQLSWSPALPSALATEWRDTATWMAPHAKYVAVYDTPFWRDQGLSGYARSAHGPLGEIHDASLPGGQAALFGFFGIPARVRLGVSEQVLQTHCRAQLVRLFGQAASTPNVEFIKDWAADIYTATASDTDGVGQHAKAPVAAAASGPWMGVISGIASEWSPQFSGYLAGAVEAASLGVAALPNTLGATP